MSDVKAFQADLENIAREFAASFPTRAGADFTLDFSKQSLAPLEAALLQLRETALATDERQELALGAGAYLAEVIRRRSPVSLRWVPSSILPGGADPANPYLLATPKNLVVAVLYKPMKLLENGIADGLVVFADRVNDLFSREATSRG